MPTEIQSGSLAANRIFNAALFTEATRRNSMTNMLTGTAPKKASKSKSDGRKQTESGAPITRVTDLSKPDGGDEVTVDLYHQLRKKPTMGDKKLAGRGESLTSSQFTLKINQGRHMVDSGGRMTQQRTAHDLRMTAKTMLSPYWNRLDDQLTLVHMAGARGDHIDSDWILPLANDPEFDEIAVNPLTPPTWDRHFVAGGGRGANDFGDLDSTDLFNLSEVDRLRLELDEMPYPIQPIKFKDDPMAEESPFYVLLVTPRQWHDFWTSTDAATGGVALRNLQAQAAQRASIFKHPIFLGECAMWNGILIKKMSRPIRFNVGTTVSIGSNVAAATPETDVAAVTTERALLIGAQALATAFGRFGKAEKGGYYFSMHTEKEDHENSEEHSIGWMNGKAKIRFKGSDGRVNDHGVAVLDTAVSAPA